RIYCELSPARRPVPAAPVSSYGCSPPTTRHASARGRARRTAHRMFTIIGIVVVLGCVIGGFAFIDGPMHVLFQPGELIIIGGAALGSLLISAPGKALGQVGKGFMSSFTGSSPTKSDYLDLLKMQYEVFQFMRKNGAVALDEHVQDFHK